jgi:hypothetical protein
VKTESEILAEAAERKAARRRRKKHPKMRVHSAGLRDLARRLARKK